MCVVDLDRLLESQNVGVILTVLIWIQVQAPPISIIEWIFSRAS